MDNQNTHPNLPLPPSVATDHPVTPHKAVPSFVLMIVGLLVVGLAAFAGYQTGIRQAGLPQNISTENNTPRPSVPSTADTVTPLVQDADVQNTSGWKTYDFGVYTKDYTFKYPAYSDWTASGPSRNKDGVRCILCDKNDNINSFMVANYFDTLEEAQKYWKEKKVKTEKISFKGLEAWKMVEPSTDPNSPGTLGIGILYKNKMYVMYLDYPKLKGVTQPNEFPDPIPNIPLTLEFR